MKQSKKRKLILGILILTIAAGTVGGTYAYYVQETRTENVITTGSIRAEILETMLNDASEEVPFRAPEVAMPGLSYSKIVRLTNSGAGDAWVRIAVDITAAEEGREPVPAAELALLDYDTSHWTLRDGYWYYDRALKAGETTEPLFTEVGMSADTEASMQNGRLVVSVTGYAVQAVNNGTSALEAQGWE